MRLGILGAGSWGTALANVFSEKVNTVNIWTRNEDVAKSINNLKENRKYLPGILLNENIRASTDINNVAKNSDVLIVAIPSQVIREVLSTINKACITGKDIITASKGIEVDTLKLTSQVIREVLAVPEQNIFVLSGPSFAKEVAAKLPTAITLAGKLEKAEKLQEKLMTDNFRIYVSDDKTGAELGGAVKNVIAIATGVSDGLGLGNNARASLITRGLHEISRLTSVYGGKKETLYGLSGMGDLVLTATGDLSRNRTFGYLLGKGLSVKQALKEVGQVVEGYKTSKALKAISDKNKLELPISQAVYKLLYEGISPIEAVKLLMERQPKREFD